MALQEASSTHILIKKYPELAIQPHRAPLVRRRPNCQFRVQRLLSVVLDYNLSETWSESWRAVRSVWNSACCARMFTLSSKLKLERSCS